MIMFLFSRICNYVIFLKKSFCRRPARNWKFRLLQKLICDRLRSIDGIRWSPNDELLCIWCSSPAEPKLIVYSTVLEKHVVAFSPLEIAQSSETTYSSEKKLKGIENIEWIPSGQLLAVIGFNEVVIFRVVIYCISKSHLLIKMFVILNSIPQYPNT